MLRTVKHVQLHRIEQTELRVISDVDTGVLPLIQVEELVIREYIQRSLWPHRQVSLFILQDLRPLIRQLSIQVPALAAQIDVLDQRPAVNIYDQVNLQDCHIFINQDVMVREGYWDDPLAVEGVLAHEHAHPLAENETIRSARSLRLNVELRQRRPMIQRSLTTMIQPEPDRRAKMQQSLTLLAEKLCLYAPREVFANDVVITSGFGRALLHLDQRNLSSAERSIAGREYLYQQLQRELRQGKMSAAESDQLLLLGDLTGYLDLALEIAPFYRTGQATTAQELEAVLEKAIFPYVAADVARIYSSLCEQYIALRSDLSPDDLLKWGRELLDLLVQALQPVGLHPVFHLQLDSIAEG